MTTTQTKKEQYATCEECERLCYTGGTHEEGEEYYCADCGVEVECEDFDPDARDAPNWFPYKKCSVCGERKSCGNYRENDWFCENCAEKAEEEEELAYDCVVCKKHLYITEMAKCEERELCAECCVGPNRRNCPCYVCVANN